MHLFSHPGKHTGRSRCRELANFGSGPTLVCAPSSGGIAHALLESFASLSVWLPALLTFYALARWVNIPLAAHLIVGSAILCAVWARRAAPPSFAKTSGTNFEFLDLALLLGLITLLLLPVIAGAIYAYVDAPRFYYPDDAALVSIAQGQRLSFPRPICVGPERRITITKVRRCSWRVLLASQARRLQSFCMGLHPR
jgi:hypothetical protein